MDLDFVDNMVKNVCQFAIETQDHNIDSFLTLLNTIHSFTALTQQEITDIANGTIIFSEKYLNAQRVQNL